MKKRKVASLHDKRVVEKVHNLLRAANNSVLQLVFLADKDPEIMERCLDPDFCMRWELQWLNSSKSPSYLEAQEDKTKVYTPLLQQKNISAFHRIAGLIFLNHGIIHNNRALIIKAAEQPYYSFHALKFLAREKLKEIGENEFAQTQALLLGKRAAKVHHCPGYLLLAELCFWIGQPASSNKETRGQAAYQCCLQHLLTALELEKHCLVPLHNAYYGNGIQFNGSTYDNVRSLINAFENFIFEDKLQLNHEIATTNAKRISQEIIQDHYTAKINRKHLFN